MRAYKQRHDDGAQGVQEVSVHFQMWIHRKFSKLPEDVLSCVSHFSLPATLSGSRVLETACGPHVNCPCSFSIRGRCGVPGVQTVAAEAMRQDPWVWEYGTLQTPAWPSSGAMVLVYPSKIYSTVM